MCMDQCYKRFPSVSTVRSKSNTLLVYVFNFLIVFFVLMGYIESECNKYEMEESKQAFVTD